VNDCVDIDDDRQHDLKKGRPIASGELPISIAIGVAVALLMISFAIAAFLPIAFSLTLCTYIVMTSAYSFFLKKIPIVDVSMLSLLYTIRIIAGNGATGIIYSFWLLLFSAFFFFSLALLKRYAEFLSASVKGVQDVAGRGYVVADLPIFLSMGVASGFVSILVLGLYVQSDSVALIYRFPHVLWIECVLMLFWISRYWFIAHRGRMHQDPILFTMTDPMSYWIGIFVAFTAFLAS
jgi:4-hydroxybenzoate polyprenyltransferase